MSANIRLAITAELHWGIRPAGDEATRLMLQFLHEELPDLLLVAGDVGAGDDSARCLAQFDALSCRKALVPGNHDIWVHEDDPRGDSLRVYHEHLPRLAAEHGFHYLDHGPLLLPEADLGVAGSINWYDYSWSLEVLKQVAPDWEERLRTKRFLRGRHNDARFVHWPLDDQRFTAEVVGTFARHMEQACGQVSHVLVVTHHPAFYGLSFPRPEAPASLDALLWDAFSGNRSLESLLGQWDRQVPFVFSGHTHRARENKLGTIRGWNVGGDYHFKRMLLLDWPSGQIEAHQFGQA